MEHNVGSMPINIAFGCLLAAMIMGAARRLSARSVFDLVGNLALGLACCSLSVYLAMRWRAGGFAPLSNQYESVIVMTWSILLFHFILTASHAVSGFGFWTSLLSLLFLGIASILDPTIRPLMPALQSNWLIYHVTTTMLAYAAFALSFVSAIVYLVRHRSDGDAVDAVQVDGFTYRATVLGFILLTIGVILGAVWANEAWGTYWSWDPKETWSLITWFVYAGALHLRRMRNWRDGKFAWFTVAGFACVLFTYFGVNFLLSGLHSYA